MISIATKTPEWVLDRFDGIYPAYRQAFASLLVTLRRDFEGDLDAMLVLLSVSLGTTRKDWEGALLGSAEPSVQLRLTNTQSIADTTGIPRESVRRKLMTMAAKGWVQRDAKGGWEPTHRAASDLRESSAETITFITAVLVAAQVALPRQERGVPPEEL